MRFVVYMLLASLVGLVVLVWCDESGELEVTRHRLGSASLPGPGMRIALVSDLHVLGAAKVEEAVLRVLQQEPLDLIVLTGDLVTHREKMGMLAAFLRQLPERTPKVAIPGNWEYWVGISMAALRRLYDQHGVTLLINEAQSVASPGREREALLVVGLDDARLGQPDWKRAMAERETWRGPVLVLAHNPVTLDLLPREARERPDRVMLSGHTHGGQIVLFGTWWRRGQPCQAGWCGGEGGSMPMYVSRGIGTSIVPLRIGAKPELALFEWRW